MSNTNTIARNTGWYGLESIVSGLITLLTSIGIARTLGPSKMGYIIYVAWIANAVSGLGGIGIPATTRKYMAEFLGKGDKGTARFVYFRTLLIQSILATVATASLVIWVFLRAPAEYRTAALLVVLSIWPAMMNTISAHANVAAEKLSRNLPGSLLSMLLFFFIIAATTVFHWGVLGVGFAVLLSRAADFMVRAVPTVGRIASWASTHVYPPDLRKRMINFAWQSVASMVVALIVWDRSEFVLLKSLCADIRQVAYYSVAFSMAERLLMTSAVFGSATSATIFAQYGRDKLRLPEITASSFRHLAQISIPLHLISCTFAAPALTLLYGRQYAGALVVVSLAPLLCLPKAFVGPIQSMLQSSERQSAVLWATVFAGLMDVGVTWWLVPAHGAVGACIGSGAAQFTALFSMWGIGIKEFKVKLPWRHLGKISIISAAASLTAFWVSSRLTPIWAIIIGGCAALGVLAVLGVWIRVFEPVDITRFRALMRFLPGPVIRPADRFLRWLSGRAVGPAPYGSALETDSGRGERVSYPEAVEILANEQLVVGPK